MKKRTLAISITILLALITVSVLTQNLNIIASSGKDQPTLSIDVKFPKTSYILGEVVKLDIEIRNNGSSDVFLRGADVRSGFLRLFIANNADEFKQYSHSAWISGKQPGFVLKPGLSVASKADLLWNVKPELSHLNEEAATRISKNRILTDYAFSEPGTYRIKAVLTIPGEPVSIRESEPIEIIIDSPVDRDLEVWNRIKANGEMAYFIQQGEVRSTKTEEQEKLILAGQDLVDAFADTVLGSQINDSLTRFRTSSAKRKDFMEKLQKQKPQ